jgi:hypothetical protein
VGSPAGGSGDDIAELGDDIAELRGFDDAHTPISDAANDSALRRCAPCRYVPIHSTIVHIYTLHTISERMLRVTVGSLVRGLSVGTQTLFQDLAIETPLAA